MLALVSLAEHLPKKEGLRQYFLSAGAFDYITLAEHLPKKEGLRLSPVGEEVDMDLDSQSIFQKKKD